MSHRTPPNSIDSLIKKIYSSYIEIKSGDFREIEKDALLRNIQELYLSIKNLYPNPTFHQIEIDIDTNSKLTTPIPKVEQIEKPVEVEEKKIDPPLPPIEEKIAETIKIKEEVVESKKEVKLEKPIENIEPISIVKNETPVNHPYEHESYLPKEQPPIHSDIKKEEPPAIQNEKKSTKQIMDFLHDEENTNSSDLYSILDINTRIGLVERFFKGDTLLLSECFSKLNSIHIKEECIEVIKLYARALNVKQDSEIFQSFITLIDRKFIYNK